VRKRGLNNAARHRGAVKGRKDNGEVLIFKGRLQGLEKRPGLGGADLGWLAGDSFEIGEKQLASGWCAGKSVRR